MEDNFYVTLPSNIEQNAFPENVQSNYITILNPPIVLSGDWTVGLTEIHIPKRVQNVTEKNNLFEATFADMGRFDTLQTVIKRSKLPLSKKQPGVANVYMTDLPNVVDLSDANMVAFELDIDPSIEFTREQYLTHLQIVLESMKDKTIHGITFQDGIKIEYRELQVGNDVSYVYFITFKNHWKLLFDADDIEDCHVELARMFGTPAWSFFQPKERTMLINKFDNLNGEREEFKAKLKPHRIYIFNTKATSTKVLLKIRERKINSMKIKSQQCIIPEGSYVSATKLIAAMTRALPKQMEGYFKFSVAAAGHLKITSFNHKYFNVVFPSSNTTASLGQMLGIPTDDLDTPLPSKPLIFVDGVRLNIEDPDTLQTANLTKAIDVNDLPEDFLLDPLPGSSVNASGLTVANLRTHGKSAYDPSYGHMGQYISMYPVDMYAGVYGLYVYCDIVAPGYTGNQQANLLRVVPTNVDNIGVFNYSNEPHYKPVSVQYITQIQIVIKSDVGDDIKFSSESKTLCKLHFKKKI